MDMYFKFWVKEGKSDDLKRHCETLLAEAKEKTGRQLDMSTQSTMGFLFTFSETLEAMYMEEIMTQMLREDYTVEEGPMYFFESEYRDLFKAVLRGPDVSSSRALRREAELIKFNLKSELVDKLSVFFTKN